MTSNAWHQCLPARYWFLFNTWFSLLAVCVSAAATLHIPISGAAWPIFIVCSGLVIFLAIKLHRTGKTGLSRWSSGLSSLLIIGAALVALWGSLVRSDFVSVYPDPWAYTAFATYVQNPVPPVGAGLQPIVSFGRSLMGARYGTAGLLALFAEISGTDPCRAAGIYAFLIVVQVGLGFTLLARMLGAGRILSLSAGLYGVLMGWVPEILKIGNWDQVLFLSFIPFGLIRMRFLAFQTSRTAGVLSFGLCLGAMTFIYPEGLAVSGVIYLPVFIWRLLKGDDPLGKIRRLAVGGGVALLVSSVYLPTFVSFLLYQLSASAHQPAGTTFSGLLSPNWLPTFYGLGENPVTTSSKSAGLIAPLLFVGLSLLALSRWWRKKDGIVLSIPTFLLLSLWQAALAKYSYGFYKVLTMFWPVLIVAIFVGMSKLLARYRGWGRPVVVTAFCGLVLGAFFEERANFQYEPWQGEREIRPFLDLKSLKTISGDAPICILSQSWVNQLWAVFFLQGYELIVPDPLNHLSSVSSSFHAVTGEQVKRACLLSDGNRSGAVWHNEIFSLKNHLDPVELLGMEAPNHVETVQGDSFIWLNNQPAAFTIYSDADRQALLIISECWPGPSRPEDERRTLIVEVNGERTDFSASTKLKVPLKLRKGINIARLSCKEAPTVDKLSAGETRTLLLGIKGFRLAIREESVEISGIDAPNHVETVQGDSFIWLNNEFTDLTIHSDANRQAMLNISECWPGPSRPEDKKRTLIVEVNGARSELTTSSNLKVPLKLNQGKNLIRLSCKEAPTVDKLSSGDTRTLLLGVKGFSVTSADR
jgi:hypothetical protein